MYISESVAMLYFAMTWQLIAFGLYLAAMVDFINTIMSRGEAVRGQAVYTIMVTVGTVLSSIIGGWILDNYNVKMFLGIATLLTAAGMAVIILHFNYGSILAIDQTTGLTHYILLVLKLFVSVL